MTKYQPLKKRMPRDLKYERAKLIYQYRTIDGMTLEKIGKIFSMTRERVRQILNEYQQYIKEAQKLDKKN